MTATNRSSEKASTSTYTFRLSSYKVAEAHTYCVISQMFKCIRPCIHILDSRSFQIRVSSCGALPRTVLLPRLASLSRFLYVMYTFWTGNGTWINVILNTVSFSILVWFGSASHEEKCRLQAIVKCASKIIGSDLQSLKSIYIIRCARKSTSIDLLLYGMHNIQPLSLWTSSLWQTV